MKISIRLTKRHIEERRIPVIPIFDYGSALLYDTYCYTSFFRCHIFGMQLISLIAALIIIPYIYRIIRALMRRMMRV